MKGCKPCLHIRQLAKRQKIRGEIAICVSMSGSLSTGGEKAGAMSTRQVARQQAKTPEKRHES